MILVIFTMNYAALFYPEFYLVAFDSIQRIFFTYRFASFCLKMARVPRGLDGLPVVVRSEDG